MHGRVLLAEEDGVLASSLHLLLSRNDYGVVTVARAEEAVARLAEDPDYDLVLLDVGTGMQGHAWCKQVRDQGFRSPIILLGTRCTLEDRVAGLAAGADDCITKPFSSPDLLARVEAQVRRTRAYFAPAEEMLEITQALVISGLLAQEKAEAATEGARRLRSLVQGLDAIVWEADAATCQYSFVSQRAEQLLGYPIERWLADPDFWINLIHPLDRSQTVEIWQSAIQEDSQFSLEYRALTADNRVLWLRNLINVRRDAEGHPQELRGVIIDVTQHNTVDTELAIAYRRAHRIAETLQRSMLLKVDQDRFHGLEVETFYEPCLDEAEVGGDFFDVFSPASGKVALVVGDVCGKGLLAAARTVQVKYALRAFLHEEHPSAALSRLNNFLWTGAAVDALGESFVVLSLAVLDQVSGEAIFVAAGSELPLVLRAGGSIVPIETGGVPLGIMSNSTYAAAVLPLARGDTVLMFTDGITEARSGDSFLEPEGVAQLVEEALPLESLKQIGEAILDGARTFAGGALRDDVCLLLARRQ